ncbi:MAG: hypothetical protein Q4A66_10165 [Eubacteriales bacterium]|nr:hypothetical protein [Eubacteriales bacterium]
MQEEEKAAQERRPKEKKPGRRRARKTAEAFKSRAKELAIGALDRLGEIALDPESAAQHAIPAGKAIIEYAYGKPGTEKDGGPEAGMARLDELIEQLDRAAKE